MSKQNPKTGFRIKEVSFKKSQEKYRDHPNKSEYLYHYDVVIKHREVGVHGELTIRPSINERSITKAIEKAKELGREKYDLEIMED